MAFKDTVKHLKDLLAHITTDLEKAEGGNKAASQRVRTGTVKLEKIAKVYRKESIKNEKSTKGTKKASAKSSASKAKAAPAKKGASHAASHHAPASKTSSKAASHAKGKTGKTVAKSRPLALKRPTAKLPNRRLGMR